MHNMNNSLPFHDKCQVKLNLFGLSQGLGLRPKLFCHAQHLGLAGTLQNRGDRLQLLLEGRRSSLLAFLETYRNILPTQARIEREELEWSTSQNLKDLKIIASTEGEGVCASIPSDLATCPDCWEEFRSPLGVRSNYPFISCTVCGPRYSVFLKSPYDRINTTFNSYPLCLFCRSEYEDPSNRRFHAQTVACPDCGPRAIFKNVEGDELHYASYHDLGLEISRKLLEGSIIAFQGLGGFALVCDANNSTAIQRLRKQKQRPHQPLAIMGRDLGELKKWVKLSHESEVVLTGQVAPIVIVPCTDNIPSTFSDLNPDGDTLGVMLPSHPFQSLLFGPSHSRLTHLVYTSGNRHGEPLAFDPKMAQQELALVADYFLYCDRPIARPVDDTVIYQSALGNRPWRQARGLAPLKTQTHKTFSKTILALGADLKNTFSIGHKNFLWTSPHQGDLENLKSLHHYRQNTHAFCDYLGLSPDVIVVDRHPGYQSHQWGSQLSQEQKIPLLQVGHHRAHAAAAAFLAGWEDCLNLVYDGTGLGDDGTLWGGELFAQHCPGGLEHLGSYSQMLLPGGEQAISHPARLLVGYLKQHGMEFERSLSFFTNEDRPQLELIFQNCNKGINSPLTSSVGRLFDLVSVILGAHHGKVSYEAQAAIRLETMANKATRSPRRLDFLETVFNNTIKVDPAPMIENLLAEISSESTSNLALDFHFTLAHMALVKCIWAREKTGQTKVTLSGGVFHNELLNHFLFNLFQQHDFQVFLPKLYPVGDASISLGQAILAGGLKHA